MQKIKLAICLGLTVAYCYFLNGPLGPLPPLGKFTSPFQGFWQNCESKEITFESDESPGGLKAEAKVFYDDRRVPHIFASNTHDLFYLQGYLTAKDRLFQMDLQTRFAGGRISEWFGRDEAFANDRRMRRLGLPYGAKHALEELMKDPESREIVEAYVEGVNAWIHSLNAATLPLEYKLIHKQPEEWTAFKTCLLLKMMAFDLTGRSEDASLGQVFSILGRENFDLLFPLYSPEQDPIIQSGTAWDFQPDSVIQPTAYDPGKIKAALEYPKPDANNGSNNWAIAGSKSASGYPILANDPHLGLRLPSIWYEIQLHMPGMNVYGVSLPGSPLVVIGFNEKIAWGLTNAQRDVLDWYRIEFKDASRNEYKFGNGWEKTRKEIEIFRVNGRGEIPDTIVYTQHGPVVYDRSFHKEGNPMNLACRWTAHDPSNELRTFLELARASNYNQYMAALKHFKSPGQNFVFACSDGDIAITQQGRFPLKWKNQGRFVLDGADPEHLWQKFIPEIHNPTVKNPARGFVSSANQHPTDSLYPYDIAGSYEYYRNRRINQVLAGTQNATTESMKNLQLDNYNLCAAENLDSLIILLNSSGFNAAENAALDDLKKWNRINEADLSAPAVFDAWSDAIREAIYLDEIKTGLSIEVPMPKEFVIHSILRHHKSADFIDDKNTTQKETAGEIVTLAFKKSVAGLLKWKTENGDRPWKWSDYRHTVIAHLIPGMMAFSREDIHTGGNDNTVNSMKPGHGPSWKMVVEVGPEPKGWGVFPGGASGNPGSFYYDNGVTPWARGEYFPLLFFKPADEKNKAVKFVQTFKP